MQLTVSANAKINWALDVLSRREDGYHELDMLMQTIDLSDEISFSSARWTTLSVNGRPLANGGKNLIVRAANALNDYMGEKRGVRISLKKRIPIRAGLGGGSADCAAALLALNDLWRLRLPLKTLEKIGAGLGADVPYCLRGGLCRVRGIGDEIENAGEGREDALLLVCVGAGLSTQAVFAEFDSREDGALRVDIRAVAHALNAGDYARAQDASGNALERAAMRLLPEINDVLLRMRHAGALYARMSGSGSAVYGVFESAQAAKRVQEELPGSIVARTLAQAGRA